MLHDTLKLSSAPLWLRQVHGNRVVLLDLPDAGVAGVPLAAPEADAGVSRVPGRVSVVLTADCLPVLFCDRAGCCVAAAHAGWRGLVAGVLESTVQAMRVDPGELLAWLGPAIGPQAFEVGDEVRTAFVDRHPQAVEAFLPRSGHRWLADLYRLARIRLKALGVSAIYGGDHCTFTENEVFYSYRREGVTGRMASLIWLSA